MCNVWSPRSNARHKRCLCSPGLEQHQPAFCTPKQDSLLNLLPLKHAKADTSVGFVIRSVKHIKIHAGRKQRGNLQRRYLDCVWSKPLRC